MRSRRIQPVGLPSLPLVHKIVKLPGLSVRRARISANIVQCKKRVVDVEQRVLQSFGFDSAGQLLPAHYKTQPRLALFRGDLFRIAAQQYITNELEILLVDKWIA